MKDLFALSCERRKHESGPIFLVLYDHVALPLSVWQINLSCLKVSQLSSSTLDKMISFTAT